MRELAARSACLWLAWGLAALAAVPAGAQEEVEALAGACAGSNPAVLGVCLEGALTVQAAQSAVGLLAAGGAQLPGSGSTLGRRFGGTPRISVSLRGGFLRSHLPDVQGTTAPFDSRGLTGTMAQGSLALGVFDGFSLLPTLGGFLSLDVLGAAGLLRLPEGAGFRGDSRFWGLGVRLGLLRESFTAPGVTVEASWRSIAQVSVGDLDEGDRLQVDLDPAATSVRALLSKDLLAIGVLAGVGWDRYRGEGTLRRSGAAPGEVSFQDFESERILYFGGAALNLLLLQLSAEGGWAKGFDAPAGRPERAYDAAGGSLFLSLAARLTL